MTGTLRWPHEACSSTLAIYVAFSRFAPFFVRPMTLQDWSDLAQVVGASAVVISLFYVGFQIKRNTSAVRSVTAQAVHDNYADWYMNLMGNTELNRIAIKGLKDYSSLNETEKAQFIETFMAFISFSQNAVYPWREKALSPPLGLAGNCSS